MSLDDNCHNHQQSVHLFGRWDADGVASELHEDPVVSELTEEFSDELGASLEAEDSESATRSAGEVAQRLGLSW